MKYKRRLINYILVIAILVATLYFEPEICNAETVNDFVIVLDAGHGGSDGGASSVYGGVRYNERDLNLKITNYCAQELRKYSGIKVYLTRTNNTDANIDRSERVRIARNYGADLIVSFHLNSTASRSGSSSGAEVYYQNGNYRPNLSTRSYELANQILSQLSGVGVRRRGAFVRNSSDSWYPDGSVADDLGMIYYPKICNIPSVLIENAYLNNYSDFQNFLSSESKLQQLGIADARGIYNYVKKYGYKFVSDETGISCAYLGTPIVNKWAQIFGNWYYLDANGYCLTGKHNLGGNAYIFKSDGVMAVGWAALDGKWYWADKDGHLKNGWINDGKYYYYMDNDGIMQRGWLSLNGKTYYLNVSGGHMQVGEKNIDGNWYNFASSGELLYGWQKVSGNWKYYNADGIRQSGLIDLNGSLYYLDANGKMLTGWISVNGKWYFANSSGKFISGWLKNGNEWYYLNADCVMERGMVTVGTKKYYLNPSGGYMITGWKMVDGEWYYFCGNGDAVTGWEKIDNRWYYFDSSGIMKRGMVTVGTKKYYLNPSGGHMFTGWKKLDGKWYYFSSNGDAVTGWQKIANVWYYFNDDAEMTTGWQKVNGTWYYMNASGAWVSNPTGTPPEETE